MSAVRVQTNSNQAQDRINRQLLERGHHVLGSMLKYDDRRTWNAGMHSDCWMEQVTEGLTTLWLVMDNALKHLEASPSEQRAYLAKGGFAPELDELALELDDVIHLVPRFIEAGWLSEEHSVLILAVSQKLCEMSGAEHTNLWRLSALELSPEWATVRELANTARRAFISDAGNHKGTSSN